MNIRKYCSSIILIASIVIILDRSGQAKSLYISMSTGGALNAYKIQGSNIQYQTFAQNPPWGGSGLIGLALDTDSDFIFVTQERSPDISLLNAKTMVFEETSTNVEGAGNLSGIAFDKSKQKIYVVDRTTQHLFVYLWNNELKALFPESESYVLLSEVLGGAWGIDIDKQKGELYVTNSTNTVHRYDVNNWFHKGSISINIGNPPRTAVGIAIDSTRHYMYTGSFTGIEGQHTFLVRTDINDPNNPTFSEKNVGDYVIGLSIDEETSYLYVGTIDQNYSAYTIRVYNTLTWPSDPCSTLTNGVSGPAGMCLGGNVQYKPPLFHLEKVDVNEPNSVLPDSNITYRITYGPDGVDHNNVVITDFLPGEVNYINPLDSNYNAENHTYTWLIDHLDANSPNSSKTLIVKVNAGAAPDSIITNYCEIESDDAYYTATATTTVGFWQPYSDIIYVDYFSPCFPGTGISWQYAYTYLQDALSRAADGNNHQIWVAAGTYTPTDSDPDFPENDPTFKLINGVSLYGHFAGDENSIAQRNLTNSASETILNGENIWNGYTVTASELNQETILDGFTIPVYSPSVWIKNSHLVVSNCVISGIGSFGIHADSGSNITVANCTVQNVNSGDTSGGIYVKDSNFTITGCNINSNGNGIIVLSSLPGARITNNIICNNHYDGINVSSNYSLLISNNWIYHNEFNGIYISDSDVNAVIRNDTIVSNGRFGIDYSGRMPVITSSIVCGHEMGDIPWGCTSYYSWLTTNGDPCFTAPDENNFHLRPDSNCIDTGDPAFNDFSDTDIDGECRIIFGDSSIRVDIGADELYRPKADYNHDDIVNFNDYAIWVNCWLTNDPNGRLDDDNDVDINDLAVFCDDWILIAPWSPLYQPLGIFGMDMMSQSSTESPTLFEEMPFENITEEPSESNDQPMSAEQIQELIDWTEQLWQSNPELMEMAGQAGYDLIMESLKEQLDQ